MLWRQTAAAERRDFPTRSATAVSHVILLLRQNYTTSNRSSHRNIFRTGNQMDRAKALTALLTWIACDESNANISLHPDDRCSLMCFSGLASRLCAGSALASTGSIWRDIQIQLKAKSIWMFNECKLNRNAENWNARARRWNMKDDWLMAVGNAYWNTEFTISGRRFAF